MTGDGHGAHDDERGPANPSSALGSSAGSSSSPGRAVPRPSAPVADEGPLPRVIYNPQAGQPTHSLSQRIAADVAALEAELRAARVENDQLRGALAAKDHAIIIKERTIDASRAVERELQGRVNELRVRLETVDVERRRTQHALEHQVEVGQAAAAESRRALVSEQEDSANELAKAGLKVTMAEERLVDEKARSHAAQEEAVAAREKLAQIARMCTIPPQ